MQNIKNFRLVEPTPEQLEKFENAEGEIPLFLLSEDGRDWYECQQDFAEDTVKVMYDGNGVIHSVVDKPVPQRGNTLAVSMLFPNNMSVAEVTALPEGFEKDSKTWKYGDDGVYQDLSLAKDMLLSSNTRQYLWLRHEATSESIMLQSCADVGRAQPDDEARIQALRIYLADLRETDLTVQAPAWPPFPTLMN